MSKRRARHNSGDPDDAVLFADTEDDFDVDGFINGMERRSARRKTRQRRAARRRYEASAEERWLKGQIADWDDQYD